MTGSFAAFLAVSAVVIVTPGQDTVLTIRNTLLGGRRGGAWTALGVASGQAVWTLAASAGLAALLIASRPAFLGVRWAGAAYLVILGVQALRHAVRPGHLASPVAGGRAADRVAVSTAYRQGAISNLGNPKMAVFFSSLLPQFAPRDHASFAALLGLGLAFCGLTLGWLTAYAVVVARAGDVLRRPGIRRALDGASGAVLLGLGIKLATEHE